MPAGEDTTDVLAIVDQLKGELATMHAPGTFMPAKRFQIDSLDLVKLLERLEWVERRLAESNHVLGDRDGDADGAQGLRLVLESLQQHGALPERDGLRLGPPATCTECSSWADSPYEDGHGAMLGYCGAERGVPSSGGEGALVYPDDYCNDWSPSRAIRAARAANTRSENR